MLLVTSHQRQQSQPKTLPLRNNRNVFLGEPVYLLRSLDKYFCKYVYQKFLVHPVPGPGQGDRQTNTSTDITNLLLNWPKG